jgi:2-polyprenyl-3-methyl-5-hydroxy-6-metoxy-1,4-benzoquinol methylase
MARAAFLLRMVRQRLAGQNTDCPYCGQSDTCVIGAKRLVLQLRRCASCRLMFRWPKDTLEFNYRFYQRRYRESVTTDLPNRSSLEELKASMCLGTGNALAQKIALLKMLLPGGRVLDFGCSWGYGTFRLMSAGYEAVGFEISEPRAVFGRTRLGLTIISSESELEKLAGSFDGVFASHVLEHVPTPAAVFDRIASLLKPEGVLLGFVPNCGGDDARRWGTRWGPMCCEKHPLALDSEFLEAALPKHGFAAITFSGPYSTEDLGKCWNPSNIQRSLNGAELAIVARRTALV